MSDTWDIIRQALAAEASGANPRPFASQRTLFGIPSEVERKMQAVADEDEARCLDKMRSGEDKGDEPA